MEALALPPPHQSVRIAIGDASAVGEARRIASAMASQLGFDQNQAGKLALVATEAGTNIVHHAGPSGDGAILLRALKDGEHSGIELLAIDRGVGMTNVAKCLVDGYSTKGSSGAGLGSIQRMADVFDLYSTTDGGTILLAELWHESGAAPLRRELWSGAVCVPLEGEIICGDGFALAIQPEEQRASALIVDGLGHGQGAADATFAAIRTFHSHAAASPHAIVERMHDALRSTRGAAVGVVELSWASGQLRFVGVGNCVGMILGGAQTQSLASYNGIVGARLPRLHEFNYPWPEQGLLLLHSDGASARWNLEAYPGLHRRHPSVIAAAIYRDFSRRRDDVTVMALKPGGAYVPSF
ncbi:MAG TPA: ATP-binding SpoIIE family protein phosphatase [Polyangiales bacterium]|nr:ATP-binding SpoIIE family protein phosphatase [Polyangiales bacterium]